MNWTTKPLSELADFRLGKMLDAKKNKGTMRPYLANKNVRWGEFDFTEVRQMPFEEHEMEKFGLLPGDIVMCEGGEPGRCAIWKGQPNGMMIQKAIHRIRPYKCLSEKFLYYTFLYMGRTGRLNGLFTGATIKHLPREKLAQVTISYPTIEEQNSIADTLSTYDALIENNKRRIQLLEESARLLYKEWFVHLRFPGHEYTKIKDGMPEGWDRKPLVDLAQITMGQSPASKYYNEVGEGLPFHQGVTNFGKRFPTNEVYCTVAKRIAEPGDILFSVRAPVGRINITRDKIIIGRGLAAIRSSRDQQNFLFYNLKNEFFKEDLMGGGTIYAAIKKDDLYGVQILSPKKKTVSLFLDQVAAIDKQINVLEESISNAAAARDLLLPRLMSGEVAV